MWLTFQKNSTFRVFKINKTDTNFLELLTFENKNDIHKFIGSVNWDGKEINTNNPVFDYLYEKHGDVNIPTSLGLLKETNLCDLLKETNIVKLVWMDTNQRLNKLLN